MSFLSILTILGKECKRKRGGGEEIKIEIRDFIYFKDLYFLYNFFYMIIADNRD